MVIVGMVGLIGSGKSTVVRFLAPLIGAMVVRADKFRVGLRNSGKGFTAEGVRKLMQKETEAVLKRGGDVIVDSDFANAKKRAEFSKITKRYGAKMIYVRTVTEPDVALARLIGAKYKKADMFPNGVVAAREFWRRSPFHYDWHADGDGYFTLKKLPFKIFATIDTTDLKH